MTRKRKKQLITQAEYARRRGVTAPRISHLVRAGVIVLVDGKVDVEQADRAIEMSLNPAYAKRPGRPAKGGADTSRLSYTQAATLEKKFSAALKKLDLEEREGTLINAEELRHELTKLFTTIRTRIRSIAPKCAQEIAHLKASKMKSRELVAAVQAILKKEHDDALLELSQWGKDKKGRK